ncbi:MAG TPA: diguanylate cyclase [Desulfonatronum sp.]|nr:diguanylate cyclase [Desulfonatronum sp.]
MSTEDWGSIAASITLERQDLIVFEPLLRETISKFLTFSSHGLYFPASPPPEMVILGKDGGREIFPAFYPSERKALLPLHRHGELLGIFVARGVPGRITKTVLSLWSSLCVQIMDNLLLQKMARTDTRTGLHTAACLEESLSKDIRLVQRGLWLDTPACLEESLSEFSASVGLICLDVDGFSRINERFGFRFGDRILRDLADLLCRVAPEQALCARLQEDTLAICLSGATSAKCRQLAEVVAVEVDRLECENSITGERLHLSISQGFATYPQDFHGRQLRKSLRELTGLMLEKAQRALRDARERGESQISGFAEIVRSSGLVLDVLPMNRVLVNLGRSVDAQEGQRFLLWSGVGERQAAMTDAGEEDGRSRFCKGELQLIEVYRETSVAEIVLLHDPGFSVLPGDRLSIIGHGKRAYLFGEPHAHQEEQFADNAPGLLSSQAFMKHWAEARRHSSHFSIFLAHLEGIANEPEKGRYVQAEHRIRSLAELAGTVFGSEVMLGRFSFSSLAGFVAGIEPRAYASLAETFVQQAREQLGMAVYAGVAGYPFLNFDKSVIMGNCRKALEHALMLPRPCAMEFCSTSLTISADRFFTRGDIFSAVEEYKLALLTDELNHLARNSLGVCYARLGKLNEAQEQFAKILALNPQDIMATYNQGHTFFKQGESERAEQAFKRCLDLDPRHVFSLLRLGQLAEERGDDKASKHYFEQASLLPGGKGLTHRHLARLELRRGNAEQAREHLHQALVFNPRDALAMHLLAKLYLEQGEDPEIAETLARQSAALKPEQGMFWEVLADALEAQGRREEAALARERAN